MGAVVLARSHVGTVLTTGDTEGAPRCFLLKGGNALMYPNSVEVV